jgi:glucose/arabinose dehydrogenase
VGKLGLQTIISNPALESLTDAVQPPDSNDWYLVQETGQVRILRDGQLLPQPFLDLSSEFAFPLGAVIYEDRGLVSIAFAPDYATSGLVYVSFTPNRGAQVDLDLLLEFKRDARDPLKVDVSTRRSILEVAGSRRGSPSITDNIHNGGRVAFGPDGKLYLAMGDGGGINCGDVEPGATQDVGSLFGKLLRLDLSRPAPYGSTDNPFADNGDGRVLHYGLRNPFRFSFDRLTGDLYLGDVGQNTFEEIDFAPAGSKGLNFGWASFEGNSNLTCGRPLRAGSTATAPIFVADRTAVATNPFADYNAMIGGVVYRGAALPQLSGVYFFGGYAGARLGALTQCGSTTSPVTPVTKRCNANTPNEACLRSIDGGPAFTELRAIVEDHAGELYMVANSNSLLKVVALP